MPSLSELKIKLFSDGANLPSMREALKSGRVQGFTTNPTLMRKDGVKDYRQFAQEVLREITDLPISFEVFSDDFAAMEREAREIASWGSNVNVKIPVTNTQGEFAGDLIEKLSRDGLFLNVTALLTVAQVKAVAQRISPASQAIISVFAGRIADTGRDPMPLMREAAQALRSHPKAQLLWASSRELINIFQADQCGCHIITLTPEIIKKMPVIGKDLDELSLDTVKMFYQDAQSAGYKI